MKKTLLLILVAFLGFLGFSSATTYTFNSVGTSESTSQYRAVPFYIGGASGNTINFWSITPWSQNTCTAWTIYSIRSGGNTFIGTGLLSSLTGESIINKDIPVGRNEIYFSSGNFGTGNGDCNIGIKSTTTANEATMINANPASFFLFTRLLVYNSSFPHYLNTLIPVSSTSAIGFSQIVFSGSDPRIPIYNDTVVHYNATTANISYGTPIYLTGNSFYYLSGGNFFYNTGVQPSSDIVTIEYQLEAGGTDTKTITGDRTLESMVNGRYEYNLGSKNFTFVPQTTDFGSGIAYLTFTGQFNNTGNASIILAENLIKLTYGNLPLILTLIGGILLLWLLFKIFGLRKSRHAK